MSEANSKLRVKIGAAEVEYEGSNIFLRDEVMRRIDSILDMVRQRSDLQNMPRQIDGSPQRLDSKAENPLGLSTSTIAGLLGAKSAGDLVIAAAAKVMIVDGKATTTRAELLTEMKTAVAYYKSTMSNNLTETLKKLIRDDRLRSGTPGTYSLSSTERASLEHKLADS